MDLFFSNARGNKINGNFYKNLNKKFGGRKAVTCVEERNESVITGPSISRDMMRSQSASARNDEGGNFPFTTIF